jgi:indole-3-glycerol phosphate synthase
LPLLRKDFTVDAYQIYQAKVLGASAVLLICALADDAQLDEYCRIAAELELTALVECHTDKEIEQALRVDAQVIGINNRDLQTFAVDIRTAGRLRNQIPKDKLFVAESGIQTPSDVAYMRAIGADAVLIGEILMRMPDKTAALAILRGDTNWRKSKSAD